MNPRIPRENVASTVPQSVAFTNKAVKHITRVHVESCDFPTIVDTYRESALPSSRTRTWGVECVGMTLSIAYKAVESTIRVPVRARNFVIVVDVLRCGPTRALYIEGCSMPQLLISYKAVEDITCVNKPSYDLPKSIAAAW